MLVLSDNRLDETKQIFAKYSINLPSGGVETYANVFEICSQFVHGKLGTEELFRAYDILSDAMKNDRPDLAVHVKKEDRIRVAIRLMEELPETKGKLTLEEKSAFAYCIMTGECTQVYDEEKGAMFNGVVLFDTFEHIEKSYVYEKEAFPERFRIDFPMKKQPDDSYGFSPENPIGTTSITASYQYLKSLRYNGVPIQYNRVGSFSGLDDQIVDGYEITIIKSGLFKKKTEKICLLYVNAYCSESDIYAPKGFTLV